MDCSAGVCNPVAFDEGTCPTRFFDLDWLLPMPPWQRLLLHLCADGIDLGKRDEISPVTEPCRNFHIDAARLGYAFWQKFIGHTVHERQIIGLIFVSIGRF